MGKQGDNNFAYIDGNNLYRGIKDSGWKLDYSRFRRWLLDKYGVTKAYYFIGLIPKEKDLYTALQEAGFTLIFKEVVYSDNIKPKGNCDADLVLQAVKDAYENNFGKAVLVTSDGDYSCLVKFLQERGELEAVLSPRISKKCSILLKRTGAPITYLDEVKNKIIYSKMKKPPLRTEP